MLFVYYRYCYYFNIIIKNIRNIYFKLFFKLLNLLPNSIIIGLESSEVEALTFYTSHFLFICVLTIK